MKKVDDATADKMLEGLQLILEGNRLLSEVSLKLAHVGVEPPLGNSLKELRQKLESPAKADQLYNLMKMLSKVQA